MQVVTCDCLCLVIRMSSDGVGAQLQSQNFDLGLS